MKIPFAARDSDAGSGSLKQYRYNLTPNNAKVTMQLAGSDPFQDELARYPVGERLQSFIPPRTIEEERTDAPLPVRFFMDSRMSGIVGYVPRGLEPAVIEALGRLQGSTSAQRIPAEVTRGKGGLRVTLLMGETR